MATGTAEFTVATREDLERCPFLAEPAVRIYTLGSDGWGPLVQCLTLTYHVRPLCWVAWSPDGSRIAAGSYDGCISIWQVGPVSVGELSSQTAVWVMLIFPFLVLVFDPTRAERRLPRNFRRWLSWTPVGH